MVISTSGISFTSYVVSRHHLGKQGGGEIAHRLIQVKTTVEIPRDPHPHGGTQSLQGLVRTGRNWSRMHGRWDAKRGSAVARAPQLLNMSHTQLPWEPESPLLGAHPREVKTCVHTKTCTCMFTDARFTAAERQKPPKDLSTEKRTRTWAPSARWNIPWPRKGGKH